MKENSIHIENNSYMSDRKSSGICLWLDNYNDIFSDFDPRPYSKRNLSDDFILEARKRTKENNQSSYELKLLIPKKLRDIELEKIIQKRINKYFECNHLLTKKSIKKITFEGLYFNVLGVCIISLAFLLKRFDEVNLIGYFICLLEPLSWFLFWEGLATLVFDRREKKPSLRFYKKMKKCKIYFGSY